MVYELPIRSQWCFDVQWCPRNPSVFSAATFDGWINIYSVMGGNLEAQQKTQADKVKDPEVNTTGTSVVWWCDLFVSFKI